MHLNTMNKKGNRHALCGTSLAKRAKAEERQNNIGIFIDGCRSFGIAEDAIIAKLVELYKLSNKAASEMVNSRPLTSAHVPNLS